MNQLLSIVLVSVLTSVITHLIIMSIISFWIWRLWRVLESEGDGNSWN